MMRADAHVARTPLEIHVQVAIAVSLHFSVRVGGSDSLLHAYKTTLRYAYAFIALPGFSNCVRLFAIAGFGL